MNKKAIFFVCIFLLYLLPALIQYHFSEKNEVQGLYFGLPIMQSGDEPHYYIVLYSLVNDHDIFLTNNYNNALLGMGSDAGTKRLTPYDRHTRLFDSVEKRVTDIPFEADATRLNLSFVPEEGASIKEISGHPLGIPFFAFFFLWPFSETVLLEHLAIVLTLLVSLAGIVAFYLLVRAYSSRDKTKTQEQQENKAILYTALFALATQYWYYSKTFWAEPYLAGFLIISCYLIFVRKTRLAYLLAGSLLGVGFIIKYPFLLIIIPLGLYVLSEKRVSALIIFLLPLLLCFWSSFVLNYYLTNSLFGFNQADAVHFVLPFVAIVRWFFDPTFGLFIHAPILIFVFFGVKRYWQTNKKEAAAVFAAIGAYVLFWTSYVVSQYGGGGYSARYLVPLLGLFALLCFFAEQEQKTLPWRWVFYILLGISIVINLIAAVAYPAFTGYAIQLSFEKMLHFLF